MERECRRIVESGPADGDLGPIIELYNALAVQGKTDVNREAMAQWMNRLPKNTNNSEMVVTCRQIVAYVLGDSATLHQAGPQGRALEPAPYFRFQAIVGALNPQEAVEDAELQELLKEPWNALALSISYSLAANRAEAAKWREKACAGLESRDTDSKRAAGLLRGAKPPTQKQLDDVVLSPNLKALFVAALAIRFPEQKATLAPPGPPLEREPPAAALSRAEGHRGRPITIPTPLYSSAQAEAANASHSGTLIRCRRPRADNANATTARP